MVGVLIQVRLESKRLPQKAKLFLNGLSVVERVILNAKEIKGVNKIAIATVDNELNVDYFSNIAEKNNIEIFYGKNDDIIKRFIDAANFFQLEHVVRVTGDCPLVSYEASSRLIDAHLKHNCDYTHIDGKYINGVNSEVYSLAGLTRMYESTDTSLSEYMSIYFRNNSKLFKNFGLKLSADYYNPVYRVTIDEQKDFEMLNLFFKNVGRRPVSFFEWYNFFQKNKDLARINREIIEKWDNEKGFDSKLAKKIELLSKIN
ncbi:MAG: hypothetical protein CMB31_06595 [Euryarchaeota archaeon]|nr:hypothetical protein [Euryarchaeota archaeon]|tara:strand:+ start:39 stop:815 length:777 start_codon:yes stop_codon:yes gene_type:complete